MSGGVVFWEITSPGASENKRMMEERDREQRLKDIEGVKAMTDPAVLKLMMLFPFKVIGDTLREGSRWRDVDPTSKAGVGSRRRARRSSHAE